MERNVRLLVGTYQRLGGRGLISLQATDRQLAVGPAIADIADASFGLRVAPGRYVFAVEQPRGKLTELHQEQGAWRSRPGGVTEGSAPCHLAMDMTGRHLAVANYESGSIALFRVEKGAPISSAPAAHRQLVGGGPNRERQEGPHAHWVGFGGDGRTLYVADLGSDRILRVGVDTAKSTLGEPQIAYQAPAGSGPRHLAFHHDRPLAFLISELASTLTVLNIGEDGDLHPVQTISTLPFGAGESLGGAILLNDAGDRLYVTNRGHDSIGVFGVHDGGIEAMQFLDSGGASPRFLLLAEEERRLFVANEEGGTVCQFDIGEDGRLDPIGDPARIEGAVFLARLG